MRQAVLMNPDWVGVVARDFVGALVFDLDAHVLEHR